MRKIVIALVILSFKLNINLGMLRIGLLPDFIGYLVLLEGIKEMSIGKEAFHKVKNIADVMVYYSVFVLVYELITGELGAMSIHYVVTIVGAVGFMYMAWSMTEAILNIQQAEGILLPYKSLKSSCKFFILFQIVSLICGLVPEAMGGFAIISLIGGLITRVCYIIYFNDCKNRIEDMRKSQDE